MTVAFVQVAGHLNNTGTTTSSTIVIPVTVTTTAGNAVIAWCRCQNGSYHLTGVTDSRGNTWNIDADHLGDANNNPVAVCSAVITTPLASGDTITITLNAAPGYRAAGAAEFSGLASSGGKTVRDLNAFTTSAATTCSPSAGPSAQAPELAVTYAGSQSTQNLTLGSSDSASGGTWTSFGTPSASYVAAGYEIATSVTSFAAAWSVSANHVSAGIISYKGTAAGGSAYVQAGTADGAGQAAGAAVRSQVPWAIAALEILPAVAGVTAGAAVASGGGNIPASALTAAWYGPAASADAAADVPAPATSAGQAVTAGCASAAAAADGTAGLGPGRFTVPPADAAGDTPDAGLAVTSTVTPAAADGTGAGISPAALAAATGAGPPAAGRGDAPDAAAAPSVTAPAVTAAAAGDAPGPAVLALAAGRVLAVTAAAGGDAPDATVLAYAQPVYLGASGGYAQPRPLPGGSQVSVAPPAGGPPVFLGSLGHVQDLKYSFVMPGGPDKLTAVLKLPASLRSGVLTAGWHVRVHRGGHVCWTGRLDEPQPGPGGWTVTAVGDGQRGSDFAAIYGSWPSGQPDDLVNQAIARGLNWVNPGLGTPSWLWTGQQPDPGSSTVAAVLSQMCSRGGGTWYADPAPSGRPRLRLMPVPDDVDRLLLVTVPVARTLAPQVNRLVIRYQATADSTSGSGAAATYALTIVTSAADVTAHDVTEAYLDLSSAGVMTAAAAQQTGSSVLSLYRAAAYAGPFTASPGQLLTANGVPVDPGAEQAGHVIRLIISDFGYGGELTPATPVVFCCGSYEWDDQHGVATLSPYQTAEHSLQGLVSAITRTG